MLLLMFLLMICMFCWVRCLLKNQCSCFGMQLIFGVCWFIVLGKVQMWQLWNSELFLVLLMFVVSSVVGLWQSVMMWCCLVMVYCSVVFIVVFFGRLISVLWLLGMKMVVQFELVFRLVIILFSCNGWWKCVWQCLYRVLILWFLCGKVYYLNLMVLLDSVVMLMLKLVLFRWYIGSRVFIGWFLVENRWLLVVGRQCLLVVIISIFQWLLWCVFGQLVLDRLFLGEVNCDSEYGDGKKVLCLVGLGLGWWLGFCVFMQIFVGGK